MYTKCLAATLPLLVMVMLTSSCSNNSVFRLRNSSETGITFNNKIVEDSAVNPIHLEFIYNGSGVAVGDFNKDGLSDLYFTGSRVQNELYLNTGNLKFHNVTAESGTGGGKYWSSSASVVDINNDSLPDIFVSNSVKKPGTARLNQLYINTGNNSNGIPVFRDMAAEYNLADTSHTVMTAFFDYDNDGDLDAYMLTTSPIERSPTIYNVYTKDTINVSNDRLYRNDFDSTLNHPVFTDVSRQAGVALSGYGLGVTVSDINFDGWKDIYVTNDFNNSDHLFINNRKGGFTEDSKSYLKHTSFNAMGNDIADINNDCLPDIVTVDMNAKDNFRKKMNMSANSYQAYTNLIKYDYNIQYVRNTLQLNQGFVPTTGKDSSQPVVFSEIGFLSGIAETDWSWCPSIADFDNDGYRDILVTNGYPRDVTDNDFVSYRKDAKNYASWDDLMSYIPEIKISNYAFHNEGNLQFKDVTKQWGFDEPSFSNGAVYADLDNDGDLDYVVNNIDDEAFVYENESEHGKENSHYIQFSFKGDKKNLDGFGADLLIFYNGTQRQFYEHSPYRGYLSSVEPIAHFGLGKISSVDSAIVIWPDGKQQILKSIKADQRLVLNYQDAKTSIENPFAFLRHQSAPLFTDVSDSVGIDYVHQEADFIDFNVQKLLPHKMSEYGPGVSVADLDGNGFDDLLVSGSYPYQAKIFFQQADGRFKKDSILAEVQGEKNADEMSVLLFDADNDNDHDIYITSGGYEREANSVSYSDKFFLNDGKGHFTRNNTAFPSNFTSKSCARAVDFDKDGDLDVFIAGRVEPWKYPAPVSSFIYRNESSNGTVRFTDVTNDIAPGLKNVGLTCDALFTDFDNDQWPDLVLTGEWMPVMFFKNVNGKFQDVSATSGVNDQTGFWTSIVGGDFDNDGDMDYLAGNLGGNSFYRASIKYPVTVYGKDFDGNGSYDAIPSLFLRSSFENDDIDEYPAQTRDDMIKQIISMRAKFPDYKSYASANMEKILSDEERKDALIKKAVNFNSSVFINNGKGHFTITALPVQAQFSTIDGMVSEDFDGDGNLDVLLAGNDYGTEVSVGRYDAFNGLLLKGNGKGGFSPLSISESGVFLPGNAKALVKLLGGKETYQVLGSQNRGKLKMFRLNQTGKSIRIGKGEDMALVTLKDGRKQKWEFPIGSSFLSQSSRFLKVSHQVKTVTISGYNGKSRTKNF
jgi:enediyne biosynthesis protein E4